MENFYETWGRRCVVLFKLALTEWDVIGVLLLRCSWWLLSIRYCAVETQTTHQSISLSTRCVSYFRWIEWFKVVQSKSRKALSRWMVHIQQPAHAHCTCVLKRTRMNVPQLNQNEWRNHLHSGELLCNCQLFLVCFSSSFCFTNSSHSSTIASAMTWDAFVLFREENGYLRWICFVWFIQQQIESVILHLRIKLCAFPFYIRRRTYDETADAFLWWIPEHNRLCSRITIPKMSHYIPTISAPFNPLVLNALDRSYSKENPCIVEAFAVYLFVHFRCVNCFYIASNQAFRSGNWFWGKWKWVSFASHSISMRCPT